MALIKRLGNLLTADVHAILDLLEEPLVLLKQAIRDMDAEIEKQRQSLNALQKESVRLKEQKQLHDEELKQINQDLDLCFENKSADLARGLVKKKLQLKKLVQQTEQAIEALQKNQTELEAQLEDNLSKYESMCQQSELLMSRENSQVQSQKYSSNFHVTEDEIEIALLNEKQARSQS
ncbi:PspA/IM30 family protein [Aliikangiella coralliicola]|uniref:PspA/IM30 family protein n=1 Tax=Aliikangiella coralliicola TaxID=2592383 RepID=A0A545UEW5_9GAMM|nr:PspA/IM30 family protein [Aliikangiella coralliicola]TQV87998.1 hypothetical protein FLL46_09300 [Aliikangiella coralliicola]